MRLVISIAVLLSFRRTKLGLSLTTVAGSTQVLFTKSTEFRFLARSGRIRMTKVKQDGLQWCRDCYFWPIDSPLRSECVRIGGRIVCESVQVKVEQGHPATALQYNNSCFLELWLNPAGINNAGFILKLKKIWAVQRWLREYLDSYNKSAKSAIHSFIENYLPSASICCGLSHRWKTSDRLRNFVIWKSFDFALNRPDFERMGMCRYLANMQVPEIISNCSSYFWISLVMSLIKIWVKMWFFRFGEFTVLFE